MATVEAYPAIRFWALERLSAIHGTPVFLLSDHSIFIIVQNLIVDDGFYL